ncbi:MAG: helix-turn-helix domain-containing protein [Polyangia bacterium]|jgi:excisionase family DNA binding protein
MDTPTASSSSRTFLSDTQIAEMLAVPVATVGWWRRTGRLPYLRVGRYPRVRAADFEAFVAARMYPLAREARR